MASEVEKKIQGLCTAKDMRESTQVIMKPYANWEEYLTPAPLSIAIMGELVNISSKTDFSINKNPPKGGFEYIKYPESFRACLMQVCNSGWWAFNEAHKSMDQIRLHTLTVPDYMKNAVKILFQRSDAVIQAHLPDELENIQEISDDCLKLAKAAEDRFAKVILLVQELLEACMNAEHCYEVDLKKIKSELEEAKMKEQSSKEFKEKCEKAMKRLETELEEAQNNYKEAMDSLPSGWGIIGMDFVGGLAGSVTGLLNGLTSIVTSPMQQARRAAENLKDAYHYRRGEGDSADEIEEMVIYCRSGELLDCVDCIGKYMEENTIDWKKLYDQQDKRTKTAFAEDQLKRIQNTLKASPDCTPKLKALLICETGINICLQLAELAPEGKCSTETTAEIISKWQELRTSALAFDSKSKCATKSPCMTPKPPMMDNVTNSASGEPSAGQRATENARFRIEQTREQLNKTREQYDKCVDKMEGNEKELTNVLITMRKCEVKDIDFSTTIEMLIKGMDAMGKVKAQWEKMVQFFQMVSSIVKVPLYKSLNKFVTRSKNTQELPYNDRLFSKDVIYNQAFQASNIAGLVHMISETYTQVSNQYLMDRVSSLSKLMAMDKEKPEFEFELNQLRLGCDMAQRGILDVVRKNKKTFERNADAKLKRIEGELLAILPASTPKETRAIQEAVQTGFAEDTMAAYY
ncbi:uncharacterized protein LOC134080638 [Sardina pilchardus]|uniref:uncharacterized protein LOC134080638 n=1 Tax=Sardina pilchardus TaxID=27697 RepID=UPI002E15EC85